METSAPAVLLEQFSHYIAEHIGLHFPRERWKDLERNTGNAAKELGFKNSEAFIEYALTSSLSSRQADILASNLTVGETYFYREKKAFDALENYILPELLASRGSNGRNIRLWSAGCCSGEEPYSLAIALNEMIPDLKKWNVSILATDINPRFLKKAVQAVYGEWSFREAPGWLKEKYFTKTKDKSYEIKPHIKKMVTFAHLNMAEDVYPSLLNNTNAMDIIFCRNMLMYFTPEHNKKAIHKLHNCLVDGGWLIVSSVEASPVFRSLLNTTSYKGLTVYRKNRAAPPEPAAVEIPFEFDFSAAAEAEAPPLPWEQPQAAAPAEEKETATPEAAPYEEALALYQQGLYSEVTDNLPLAPGGQADPRTAPLMARACANQGKLADALEWCTKAISEDKLSHILYYLQATILEEKGDFEAASACLKKALYLDQDFILAHIALGNLMLKKQKTAQADKHLKNAISLLKAYPEEGVVPESEGMTAGRLMDIINSTRYVEKSL